MDILQKDTIDIDSKIEDVQLEFPIKTFTGYKKISVLNELQKTITNSRIEELCFWTAELHCSGCSQLLWDKLIILSSKMININNPKLSKYIWEEYQRYLEMIKTDNHLELRNNYHSRQQLHTLILIFSQSKKISIPTIPKIYDNDYEIGHIQTKLMAKNTDVLMQVFKENDPQELKIAINEFLFHLQHKNLNWSLYWLNWILEYEKKRIQKDKHFHCHIRKIDNVDSKFHTDVSWLLWNCILYIVSRDNNQKLEDIKYIYFLYKIHFCKSKKNNRLPLIVHAILILIEELNYNIPLIQNNDMIHITLNNIDAIYKKIKMNKVNEELKIDTMNHSSKNIVNNVLKNKEDYLKKNTKHKNQLNEISKNKIDTIMKINNELFHL